MQLFSAGWFSQGLERREAFSFIIVKAAAPFTFFFLIAKSPAGAEGAQLGWSLNTAEGWESSLSRSQIRSVRTSLQL